MSTIDQNIPVVIITGANRGLGLDFVRLIVTNQEPLRDIPENAYIVATSRDITTCNDLLALQKDHSDRLFILPLDLSNQASIDGFSPAFKALGFNRIDVLINNAGMFHPDDRTPLDEGISIESYQQSHLVNAIGPIQLTSSLLDIINATHTLKGGEIGNKPEAVKGGSENDDDATDNDTKVRIMFVSSMMASITNADVSAAAYRTSKASLNMMVRMLAAKYPHLAFVIQHPGWVATGMGGESAPIKPEDSVRGCIKSLNKHGYAVQSANRQWSFDGSFFPW